MSGQTPAHSAPRAIAPPPGEAVLLEWWSGVYAHVFVAFHPLSRPAGGNRGQAGGDVDLDALKAVEPVRWAALAAELGAPCDARFARALWRAAMGVGDAPEAGGERALTERIGALFDAGELEPPWPDTLAPMLERPVAALARRLGVETLVAWDEWRETSAPIASADLAAEGALARQMRFFGPFALHAAAGGLLITSTHGDLWSLIALGDDAVRARARPETLFEGFYADASTRAHWLDAPC